MSQAIRKLEKGNKVEQDLLFKDGNRNISLNQLQTNANQNLQSYLDSKSWGRRKRQAFMDAYSDMMSSINNGNIKERDSGRKYIDSSGRINNSQGRGFDAYGEAANFLDTIVDAMPNYTQSTTTTPEKKKFDTNGLITYFKNKAFGGKDPDLMVWQDRDQIIDQDSGKRAVTNRANYFADIIRDYSNTLSDEYDFSDTPFQDKNDLLSRLRTAETSLRDNTFNNNDLNSLTSLGIDGKLARMLFSETPYKESEESEEGIDEGEEKPITAEQYKKLGYTDEQISTIMQAQQIQEQQQKEGLVQQAQEIINNRNMEQWINSLKNKPFQSRVNLNLSTYKPAYNEKWVVDNFNRSYNKDALNWLNHELQLNYFIDPNKQRVFRGKLNNTYQHLSNNLDWAIKSRMLDNNKISENLYAIPTTLDYDRQSVIVYNPNSGQVQEVSLLNYLDSPKVQKWLSDYYYNNVAKHKEGGVLKYQSGGDFDNFYNYINNFDQIQKQKEEEKLKPIKEKAERENITLDQAKARERKLSEGLSGEDWTRIGASVLDIISAGSSYIPVYGTAVSAASGVASTLANLGADAADESVTSGQMWRNLGYGLGMDAIGLIPGLGTSAKAAKVARVLRPVSKALVRALQVSTIKDAVSAVPSIQKVISNPKDATTEDLRKISVGIQALLGAHRGQVGINTNNKYTSDITTNILTTKSGKNAKISVDQLKELKKKKGYDEQNEYFKSITEGQELPKEFKHYNDNWFKRPFTYLFRSGPEVEVQREVKLLPGVEYSKWGIYRKTNQNNKKKTNQTSKQTPKQKPKLSSQQIQRLESLGYTKLTPQDIKIINHQRQLFGKPKLTEEEIKRLQSRESRQKNNSPKSFLERLADFKQNKQKNKNQWTVEDARKELQEAERQQKLGVPVQGSEIIKPEASQVRFINRLNQYIPVVHKVKPVTKNVPAVIPRPNYNIQLQGYQSPFNFRTITDNLNRLDRERLGRDIGQTRVQRAVENNPLRIERIQDQRARDNVSRYFNLYGIPYYKDQLYGAARKNRQNMYNQLFGEPHRQSKKKKKTSRDDKVTRKQQGGVLDLTKIKKFQNAGKITLNNGVVDWDSLSDPKKDILWPGSAEYSKSPLSKYVVPRLGTSSGVNNVSKSQNYSFDTNSRLKSMIDRLKNNTISPDNISEMQRRHWGMYYTWQPQDTPIYKEQVANYQTDYQNLGLNNEIIAPGYSNNYIINSPNPNSGDSTPNWTSDGLYSQITDDRRVLARKADYDNNLEQLKKDIEYAKQNGYEYYLDPETDYYMLRPIKTNDTPKDPSRDLSKNNSSVRATSYSNPIRGWIKQLGLQTPDFISAGRLFGNILNNNTVSEETLKGLKPLLVDTYNLQKYVVGDLPTKQAFYGKAAQLENLASKPRTSDASLQLAGQLEANNRGNEIRLQGDLQDNNMIKTTRDQAWQIEADNIARRSAVANKNRESLLGINKAKHDINAARRSANWVSIENFLKEKEQKELKRQELQRNFDINQLQDNIQYEQLTDPVYISLKNKAISDNATPQQINEFQKYQTLMGQRYKNRLNNAYARLYNLRTTNGYVPIISSKKGGTLQKHKVELANEKLFQENIQNSVKNHITMINNLSQVTKELILKAMTL